MGLILRNMSASAGAPRVNLSGSLYFDHGTAAGDGGGGYIVMPEVASVGNPAANSGSLYVADNSSTTTLYFKDGSGNTTNLLTGGAAGSDAQVQYNDNGSQAGAPDLTYVNALGDTKIGASTGDSKLQFRDSGLYINSPADTELDIVSDGNIDLSVGAAGVIVRGTTPKVTIGDAGAEDTFLVFDGNAQDYRIGLDDGTDKLEIGVGATHGTTTAITVDASQQVVVVAATEATSTSDGALVSTGGLSVAKSAVIGDDLDLLSDGAIVNIGSTSKFTLTDQAANNCVMAASGARLAFGNAGEYITGDGTDLAIVSSGDVDITGDTDIVGGLSSTQATVLASAAGTTTIGNATGAVITAAGIVNVNNTTEATSATDGSLQTDGGLSVVKDIVAGDDVFLLSDSAVLGLGAGKDVTITHDGGTGATLASAGAFVVDGAAAVTVDSDAALTLGGASLDVDADGGAIDIDATTTVTVGGSNATGVTIGRSTKTVTIPGDLVVNGTTTHMNVNEIIVEDKAMVLGIPGGMVAPGTATYTVSSNVVTVTSSGHGFNNSEYVFISDPAATTVITEGVYQITSTADANTFTFAFTTGDQGSATAIDHSEDNVTNATASGSGIQVAPGSATETSFKWNSSAGWLVGGASGATANLSPNVSDAGALGSTGKQWGDLFLAEGGVINWDNGDVTMTQTDNSLAVSGGTFNQDDTTDATNKTDGSLQTDGGLSVAKAIYNGTAATLAADSGIVTIGSSTAATFSAAGLLNVNNATEATSTTDGSLQTDGGLSVVKSAVIGDDLDLLSDGAILSIGSTSKFLLTDQGANNCVMAAANARLAFGDAGDYITGDGTDMVINSSGDIDIDAATFTVDSSGAGSIDFAGDASNITLTSDGAAEDFTIALAGATNSSLVLSSTGTAADALQVTASAGGIDITATGAAGEDIDIDATTSSVNVTGSEADRAAVKILSDTAAGGIQLQVADADGIAIMGNVSADTYVKVTAHTTAATEKIELVNSAGTAAGAITFQANAGGITFNSSAAVIPGSDNSMDFGSASKRWANIYTGDLHLANERGNWTLVEESDMLTFRNNLNGKWYRMAMEEIDPSGRDDGMNGAPPVGGDSGWEL